MRRWFVFVLVVPFLLPLSGCSPGTGRWAVEGTVTLDGRPLDLGSISFRPMEGDAESMSVATVRDGAFQIPAARGLLPGTYHVTVQAFQPTGRTVDDPGFAREELVEVRFRETDLTAAVVSGQDNQFDFQLTSVR